MNVTIVDYNSGNISSVINSFKEVAKNKANIEVTSNLSKIRLSDKQHSDIKTLAFNKEYSTREMRMN